MSKSRDIADSAATINYIDGLTSDAQSQLDTATSDIATNTSAIATNTSDIATKAPLSNPTFTGTVTATAFSGDGSSLTDVDSLPSQAGNAGSYLTTDGANASWGEVASSPSVDATASGGISIGDLVSVNSDGTVSLTQQATSSLTSASSSIDSTATTASYSLGYDSINDKYLLVYQGYLSRGYAVIGTLSGGSISWGSPQQVIDDITAISGTEIPFDTVEGKFILFWSDGSNSNYLATRTVQISGASLSLGTQVVVESSYTDLGDRGNAVYDPSADRVIFFFGTTSTFFLRIASLSGTTFSFGTRKILKNAYTIFYKGVYVPATQTVAAIYIDNTDRKVYGVNSKINPTTNDWDPSELVLLGDQYSGSSYVGDVISHPTEPRIFCVTSASNQKVLFSAAVDSQAGIQIRNTYITSYIGETFPSGYQKLSYNKKTNSLILLKSGNTVDNGYVEELVEDFNLGFKRVSLTEITDERAGEPGQAIISDEDTGYTIIAYHNSSDYPVSAIYTPVISTSIQFIGISKATYTDGQTAKIQLVGSVDNNQTGLSAGQQYYVQRDGTLSTTPDIPKVLAGTAMSATSIIVKG